MVLGRFEDENAGAVEVLRELVRKCGWLPLVFNYPPPDDQDMTEHVVLLAGMSSLVIVDLTDANSTPHELAAITRAFEIPIVPIVRSSRRRGKEIARVYSMFQDIVRHEWVLGVKSYDDYDDLRKHFGKIKKWVNNRRDALANTKKSGSDKMSTEPLADWRGVDGEDS